jgi:nuclear pore complex protein Nup50
MYLILVNKSFSPFMQHDDATKGWKDIGVGKLSIRSKEGAERASKESAPTIVIRNDVCLLYLSTFCCYSY